MYTLCVWLFRTNRVRFMFENNVTLFFMTFVTLSISVTYMEQIGFRSGRSVAERPSLKQQRRGVVRRDDAAVCLVLRGSGEGPRASVKCDMTRKRFINMNSLFVRYGRRRTPWRVTNFF